MELRRVLFSHQKKHAWDGKKFNVSFALDPFFTLFEAPVFPKQPIVWANEPGEADRRGRDQIVWKGRVINGGRRQREGKGSGDRFPPGLTQRDLERIRVTRHIMPGENSFY